MIGILGGIGASAGVKFIEMLINECQKRGANKDSDFPKITLFNLNSKGMNESGVVDAGLFLKDLQYGINVLRRSGSKRIVMVCNTAYLFSSNLRLDGSELIDLPKLTLDSLNGDAVGVICSDTSRLNKLYGNAIYCSDEQQEKIDKVISRIISGKHCEPDRLVVGGVMNDLRSQGAKRIILACTELPLVMRSYEEFVDPSKIAIQELLK